MDKSPPSKFDDKWIKSRRGKKNQVDPLKPYACLIEKEHTISGNVEDVATIFLTNKECPFTCLMCDLWKNTTDYRVPPGNIPNQIEWAISRMPPVQHIKLYNSGNFFDVQAIPQEDYKDIARLLRGFNTVIVESHPKLISQKSLEFRDLLESELEIAIGLETIHPEVLPLLNKQMGTDDFKQSVKYLLKNEIRSRAFILLRPPYLSEAEGIEWAKKSIDFAFECGVECCVVIPTRQGNGALEELEKQGHFSLPAIHSLEEVLDYGLGLKAGRIFADLWDIELFSTCDTCLLQRRKRLEACNLQQHIMEPISCRCDPQRVKL